MSETEMSPEKSVDRSNEKKEQEVDDITFEEKLCKLFLLTISYILIGMTFPISMTVCLKVVMEYERVVIQRLGRILNKGEAKGPGLFFTLPCMDKLDVVDLRTKTLEVPPQEILTKDSVTVAVDAVVYYRIFNPITSVTKVKDANRSTLLLAQTTLRNVLGTKDLDEILLERDEISSNMQSTLDSATAPWGVKVERVEIKDVRLPQILQRAMAAEAEATRESKAKIIGAQGEKNASHALKRAADTISESPTALQMRYLQALASIAAEKSSTILFPVPISMTKALDDITEPSAPLLEREQAGELPFKEFGEITTNKMVSYS